MPGSPTSKAAPAGVRTIEIETGKIFSIEESELTSCTTR